MNEKSFVPIVLRLVGAFGEHADVVGLLLGELRQFHADFFQVQRAVFR